MAEETLETTELFLPGDTIFQRHVATRASSKRMVEVEVDGGTIYEGYSIGLDEWSLQIIDLPSEEVSTIMLDKIVAISDGIPFRSLSPDEKDRVDKRTSSFRKISQTWLQTNWPEVYDRKDEDNAPWHSRQRLGRRNAREVRSGDERAPASDLRSGDVHSDVRLPHGNGREERTSDV